MAAGSFADYLEGAVLQWMTGTTFPSTVTTWYVALFTTTPADTGTKASPSNGTEVSGNNYSRVAVTASSGFTSIAASSNSTGQQITNANAVTFPQASGSWGTVTAWGLFDASTNGNLWYYSTLTASQAIGTNQTPSFGVGALVIEVD